MDINKIKKRKIEFVFLVFGLLTGLIFLSSVVDLFTSKTVVSAVVVKEYISGSGANRTSRGSHINIQWYDTEGNVCEAGNIKNDKGLSVGDSINISVDEKTQSRKVLDSKGVIGMVILGVIFIGVCARIMVARFGKEKCETKNKEVEYDNKC